MVFTEAQVYEAARLLLDGLQDGAAMEASCNAVACYYRGDLDEQRLWTRVSAVSGPLHARVAALRFAIRW